MDKPIKVLIISSDKNLSEVLNFCFDGWGYEVYLFNDLPLDTTPVKKILPDVIVLDVHSARKSYLEVCHFLKDDFTTSFIPVIALIDKRQLRSHLLSLKYGVDDYLIKPPDPLDLRVRVEMAIRRAHYSFYASSLTGLPGGRIIEECLKERLSGSKPFSFGYVDLDNFKYFNDIYGYQKGDKVLMQSAHLLHTAVKKFGNPGDFIGHIGGDDFVFITTPQKQDEISINFIKMFDAIIPYHYSKEDRANGFVMAKDRAHKLNKMNLISVSVALVARNNPGELKSLLEINEKVSEIKRYLKDIPGSKFMIDRRSDSGALETGARVLPRQQAYSPLGQILVDKKLISEVQLDEALKMHWEKGVILGEALIEVGAVKREDMLEGLRIQEDLNNAGKNRN